MHAVVTGPGAVAVTFSQPRSVLGTRKRNAPTNRGPGNCNRPDAWWLSRAQHAPVGSGERGDGRSGDVKNGKGCTSHVFTGRRCERIATWSPEALVAEICAMCDLALDFGRSGFASSTRSC